MSAAATPQTSRATWNIDPVHSVAEFKVRHMMVTNVKGQFTRVAGSLDLDEADVTNSQVQATIESRPHPSTPVKNSGMRT
ncbi:MAG TPA: YceI family protein [Terriglobia bacterium]|nr:YceI family protein [Terriglobia bacterium]